MIQENIRELVQYGLLTGLVEKEDEIYTTNRLLELFGEEDYPFGFGEEIGRSREEAVKRLPELLTEMMDYAVKKGIMPEDGVVYRDLFDTKIMGCLVGRPSEIIRKFWAEYEKSPEVRRNFSTDSVRIRTISAVTASARMKNGSHLPNTATLTLRSTFPSRKRTRRRLRRRSL